MKPMGVRITGICGGGMIFPSTRCAGVDVQMPMLLMWFGGLQQPEICVIHTAVGEGNQALDDQAGEMGKRGSRSVQHLHAVGAMMPEPPGIANNREVA